MIPLQPGICGGPDCVVQLANLHTDELVERPDPSSDLPGQVIFYCCEFCAEMAN